jgi:hypothetical protein
MVISPTASFSSTAGINSIYLARTQTTNTAPTRPIQTDTVTISNAAHARSLKLQGYSAAGISAHMGTNISTVNEYLGISQSAKAKS